MNKNVQPIVEVLKGKSISIGADGLCSVNCEDEKNVHLPFCLPGEVIEFERVKYKKNTNYYFKNVIKSSSQRVAPWCKHFTTCGGCLLQHADEGFYKEFKSYIVTDALQKYGLDPYVVKPIKIVPVGQRRRANLEAIKKGDKLFMGFHKLKSHQIVDMHECPVLTKPLQDFLPYLRAALDKILNSFQKVQIFLLEINGLVDVGLEIQGVSELSEFQAMVLKDIARQANIARLQFRYRKNFDVLHKISDIKINFGNLCVEVDPWSFLQASDLAEKWMQEIVMGTLEKDKIHHRLLDLFSGRGTFTGLMANLSHVDAYEMDPKSIKVLQDNADNLPIKAEVRDLFEKPLHTAELNKYSGVVIDPPRAGAQNQSEQLASSNIPVVIYISCNPETFARDLSILTDGGYKLEAVYPVDQFLWSSHLEVIGVLNK